MKILKNNVIGMILCLFEVAVGILLLIDPVGFTTGIIIAAGIALCVLGVIFGVRYFTCGPREAAQGQYLLKALTAIVVGVFFVFKADWFIDAVPALTIIYGLSILVIGFSKIQLTVDTLRRKGKRWYLALISAVVSVACACIILNSPFKSEDALWIFTGVTLICEFVFDVVTFVLNEKEQLEPEKEEEEEEASEDDYEV